MILHNLIGRTALAVSALAALGAAGVLGAIPASAATTVTATTSVTNHPDTTIGGLPGTACDTTSAYAQTHGPVWAHDNFTADFTATQEATPANTWALHIVVTGSYVAFADPTTCDALLSTGSLNGTYDLTVTSTTAPTAAGLKALYDGPIGFTTMVSDFFGGSPSNILGGAYDFSYQGGNYVQDTSGERGDVTPVACAVTIGKIADQTSVLNAAISPLQVDASSNYPGTLFYDATNLPKGLSIDHSSGKITGTPTQTGTQAVSVSVVNTAYNDSDAGCHASRSFNWTVSQTAPSPSASSSPAVPKGAVQTGGGKPVTSPWLPFGLGLVVFGGLALTGCVVALRRQRG